MTQFNFTAVVQSSSNPAIIAGDVVKGIIGFDSTQFGSNGLYTFTGSGNSHTFEWTVYRNGIKIANDVYTQQIIGLYQITITYNIIYNSVIGTLMEIKAIGISGHITNLFLFNAGNIGMTSSTLPIMNNINNFALTNGKINL